MWGRRVVERGIGGSLVVVHEWGGGQSCWAREAAAVVSGGELMSIRCVGHHISPLLQTMQWLPPSPPVDLLLLVVLFRGPGAGGQAPTQGPS